MELNTQRLRLCLKTEAHYTAWANHPDRLAELLHAGIADGFPVFQEEMKAERRTHSDLTEVEEVWGAWFVITQASPQNVIGTVGFHNPPDEAGIVEIGYSIVSGYRRQGLASEAVGGLVAFALGTGRVKELRATTISQDVASGGVLKVNGFVQLGPAEPYHDPDEGLLVVQGWHRSA
jgi:[ribosomal protein S5]-alanine N-acetyltransferase